MDYAKVIRVAAAYTRKRFTPPDCSKHLDESTDLHIWVASVGVKRRRMSLRRRCGTKWSTASRDGLRRWPSQRWRGWRSGDVDVDRYTPSRRLIPASVCQWSSPTDDSTCCPSARNAYDDDEEQKRKLYYHQQQQWRNQNSVSGCVLSHSFCFFSPIFPLPRGGPQMQLRDLGERC